MGRLDVVILGARNLADTQWISKPDPYCKVKLESQKHRTSVKDNNLNPEWNEEFKFTVADEHSSQLRVEVWNSNVVSDELLGRYALSLAGLVRGVPKEDWYLLQESKSNAELHLRLTAIDFGVDAPPPPPPPAAQIPVVGHQAVNQGMPAQPQGHPYHPPIAPPIQQQPQNLQPQQQQLHFGTPPIPPTGLPFYPLGAGAVVAGPPPVVKPSKSDNEPWKLYGLSQIDYDQIFAIFLTFDEDGSGALDRKELTKLARWLNFAQQQGDIDRMFREMDTDRDGALTLAEFCSWLMVNKPDPTALYGLTQSEYNTVMFTFHKYDRNQDGCLNLEEFQQLCHTLKYTNPQQAISIFRTIDGNHNGLVDLNEYLLYRARHGEQQPQQHGHE